jgi:hypothetical protein
LPFTVADVAQCLDFASGLAKPSAPNVARYNVETDNAALTLADAVRIARKVAGLKPNP